MAELVTPFILSHVFYHMLNKCPLHAHLDWPGQNKVPASKKTVKDVKCGMIPLKTCWLYGESGSMISLWPSSGPNTIKGVLWGLTVLAGKQSSALLITPPHQKGDDCAFLLLQPPGGGMLLNAYISLKKILVQCCFLQWMVLLYISVILLRFYLAVWI